MGPVLTRVALAGVVALTGLALWQTHAADVARLDAARVRSEFAAYRADHAQRAVLAAADEAARAARVAAEHRKALDAQTAELQAARAAAGRAARTADGLRATLYSLAADGRSAAAAPGASSVCQATGATSAVLADLLGRCSDRRRELAEYADEARSAAETCARLYDSVTGAANSGGNHASP